MTPVRLEPAALRSRVKHSTTEPLRSLEMDGFLLKGERLIVPKVMHKIVPKGIHKEMLDKIYNVSDLGVQKCLRRGQEIVFGRELMVKSGIKLLHVKSVMNSEISKQSNL